ncbi:polymeric immunoglobulin receptor [Antennarius striatus]|uniref:polymeric immunoglobulin receptor n=1 Tax=Antennarius striatus TaxID=241820 RepID=UPI0035B23D91
MSLSCEPRPSTCRLLPAVFCMVTTNKQRTVLEGRSITVPCHYEPQYASYVKYWCWGRTRVWCTTLARTDNPHSDDPAEAKVSISDSPGHLASIVTMNNLTEADTGWYSCSVEVGDGWTPDVFKFIYINVVHGLSVAENKVFGEVGEEVSIKCYYSERLRGNKKKWCRMGDWSSCRTAGPEENFKDALVSICDDGNRMFTVTLRNLQLSDAGWYWCIVGQMQLGVEVQVTPSLRTSLSA